MLKFTEILKSRTVWTAIAIGLYNALPEIQTAVTAVAGPNATAIINGVMALAAIYFRSAPKQGTTPASGTSTATGN